jgi:hypothetical protein
MNSISSFGLNRHVFDHLSAIEENEGRRITYKEAAEGFRY